MVPLPMQRKYLGLLWRFTEAYTGVDNFKGALDYIQSLSNGHLMAFNGYLAVILKVNSGYQDKVYLPKDKYSPGVVPHFNEAVPKDAVTVKKILDWGKPPYLNTTPDTLNQSFILSTKDITQVAGRPLNLILKGGEWALNGKIVSKDLEGELDITLLQIPEIDISNIFKLCDDFNVSELKVYVHRYLLSGGRDCALFKFVSDPFQILYSAPIILK